MRSSPRGESAVADVVVYVDGFNLYYGSLKRTPYKWLDLGRLCTAMLPADRVTAIKYYTARISARPGNPTAPNDQQIYLRALRTIPNLSITYGHFLTHSVSMALSGVTPTKRVWGRIRPRRKVRTSILPRICFATLSEERSSWRC